MNSTISNLQEAKTDPSSNLVEQTSSSQNSKIAKISAVALATFIYASVQFSQPLAIACRLALGSTVIATLSSKPSDSAWLTRDSFPNILLKLRSYTIQMAVMNIMRGMAMRYFNITVLAPVWPPLLFTCFCSPVLEEVLFRGFLQERLLEGLQLVDRHITPISKDTQTKISLAVQALAFGTCQTYATASTKAFQSFSTFCSASYIGYTFGSLKIENKGSLLPPMLFHMVYNTLTIARQLLFRA